MGMLSIDRIATRLGLIVRLVVFGLVILPAPLSAAGDNLRPFEKDAGLFDPSIGPIKIFFELRQDANLVKVAVTDFRNQVVRHINLVELRAGDHNVVWDGMGEDGQRLVDGPYRIILRAQFKDGSQNIAEVNARLASVAETTGGEVPETLPPESHAYQIKGSVSSFWRYNNYRDQDKNEGELRVRNRLSYTDDTRKVDAVFAAIKPFYDGETNYDGSHAVVEQQWGRSRLVGVFREGLGSFNDPMKLFSDFRTERKKFGLKLEQAQGALNTNTLVFRSENSVNSNEKGMASRVVLGHNEGWRIGSSYTYRKNQDPEQQKKNRNHTMALDVHIPVRNSLAIVVEAARTIDSDQGNDSGYLLGAEYNRGRLRISNGYIDLGENFIAPFADPLRHIQSDARGLEATLDFAMTTLWEFLTTPTLAVSYFDLKRHRDNERIREIDTSMRFGMGARNSFFLSWLGRKEDGGDNHSFLGSLNHQWNDGWSSRLEGFYTVTDQDQSWRCTINTDFRREADSGRLSLEWIDRRVDYARHSPFREAALRLDYDRKTWGLQLQTRYSYDEEDSGANFFGRLEYRPVFLHRYKVIAYTSIGNRAATSFQEQIEFGMEVLF